VPNAKQTRRLLFDRDPHCHWCGVETIWREGPADHREPRRATLDHLDHKFSPYRGNQPRGMRRRVLACWKCNNERGASDVAANLDEQRRRVAAGKEKAN